jgi:hypothetical protein
MEFDDVRDPRHPEPARGERQCGHTPNAARISADWLLGGGMEDSALRGKAIFLPQPLNMDERSLPQAIDGVLNRGNGNGVVVHRVVRSDPHQLQ